MRKQLWLLPLGVSALAFPSLASAQLKPEETGTLYFNTNVGSFKLLGANERKVEGKLSIQCRGTVLISGLDGTISATGMRKESDDPELKKQVYFGNGKLVIEGKFTAVQFFGRDMKSVFTGWGIVRMFGEFDKNLNTGEFWYANDPTKRPWFNGGTTVYVPAPASNSGTGVKPRIREKKSGG